MHPTITFQINKHIFSGILENCFVSKNCHKLLITVCLKTYRLLLIITYPLECIDEKICNIKYHCQCLLVMVSFSFSSMFIHSCWPEFTAQSEINYVNTLKGQPTFEAFLCKLLNTVGIKEQSIFCSLHYHFDGKTLLGEFGSTLTPTAKQKTPPMKSI